MVEHLLYVQLDMLKREAKPFFEEMAAAAELRIVDMAAVANRFLLSAAVEQLRGDVVAAIEQVQQVAADDVLWIVVFEEGTPFLVSRKAPHPSLFDEDTEPTWVHLDLSDLAPSLRFAGTADRLSDGNAAQSLWTMRKLTPRAARLMMEFWRSKVREEQALPVDEASASERAAGRVSEEVARIKFGEVAGIKERDSFDSRRSLAQAGVHRPLIAMISGSGRDGADSIVLSGGNEDDEDYGHVIVYTGHGGRAPGSRKQVVDQELTGGNLALAHNMVEGLPVRVVRGARLRSAYAPSKGYRYDGLYLVEDCWHEVARAGFLVWRFRLVKAKEGPEPFWGLPTVGGVPVQAQREKSTVLRIVRDTARARRVKKLYDYRCQVCGVRLEGLAGPYAEVAHIRPLGVPHNGPDKMGNILCLCPNHHVLFSLGRITIADDLSLIGMEGRLRVEAGHKLNIEYLRYHRERYWLSEEERSDGG